MELKNGKLSVKQKGMSFEKMSETMQGRSSRVFTRLSVPERTKFGNRDRSVQRDVGRED